MTDQPRLIEVAFPLKQASLDSVHEKNVRHGHISTLHIWPARRPLAACRAALIATLLPNPGNAEERKLILEKLAGKVVETTRRKKMPNGKIEEVVTEETVGGILHWGRESSPDLDWFRAKIREAYGGRAPKVLDPFAGGGSIPLEAMRLGCEATAIDINPVAWFILKCTLEYPQKLAGQKRPLPSFVLRDRDFMESFFKAQGLKGATLRTQLEKLGLGEHPERQFPELAASVTLEADLAWHVRAWGRWVLEGARTDLERFYPVVDGKLTVAYLWARTVKCKHCRTELPLLKTRWLSKRDSNRVVLTVQPGSDKRSVLYGIQWDVPVVGATAAQRREHDKRVGAGTMSHSGVTCSCCGGITTIEDIRLEGRDGRMGMVMTAVVVENERAKGKEYRLPTDAEAQLAGASADELGGVFARVPFGLPAESTPSGGGSGAGRAFSVQGYGLVGWRDLFTSRQLLALGTLACQTRRSWAAMSEEGYPRQWMEAVSGYLAIALDRAVNYMSTICLWEPVATEIKQTFLRFALPITWDFAEANPLCVADRFYVGAVSNIGRVLDLLLSSLPHDSMPPSVLCGSAIQPSRGSYDAIITDPPYYDAIPYSDLMDFFHVWLRRTLHGLSPDIDKAFGKPLGPKWEDDRQDGELIDDDSRHKNDPRRSRQAYEEGMTKAFENCRNRLSSDGRLVVVFASKQPAAWETLVEAIIRSGFTTTSTWPIATEMRGGVRNFGRASLRSSIWLVCKKRPEAARAGWDSVVLDEMRDKITSRLHDFWDAGIRGPDFVWAATGPALEAYSKHPVVKKADQPGQAMTVNEFLRHVRRIVVDFVVGRVLSGDGAASAVSGLDDITTYYLLHRHDFGTEDTPAGACILYAVSCGLSDTALAGQFDILVRTGGREAADEEEIGAESSDELAEDGEEGSGSKVRLKPWSQRKRRDMGYEVATGRPVPLIDQGHRLMFLWKAGDVGEVSNYLDVRGLRRSALFHQLLQALIELAPAGSDERSLLESISNYIGARGTAAEKQQPRLAGL
ncbi:MAG: DUF1156 domain-containing protein [Chloroflexi bacterium]|nr:DUF1156 domain-containing protein [Chloroflexota bacterium]